MRKKHILRSILFSSAVTGIMVLTGCSRRPPGILSDEEMVEFLSDLELAEAYYNTSGPGKIERDVLIESVLLKHGVSHEQLDSTLSYYGRNMDEYSMLYEKVENKLKAENNNSEALDATNDIWPYSHYASILPVQATDGIIFSMPAGGLQKGSSLEWRMRLSDGDNFDGMLGVEYESGPISYVKKNLNGRSIKISIQTDTALTAKRIFGSIVVAPDYMPLWADSIRLIRTDLDSMTYSQIHQQRNVYPARKAPVQAAVADSIRKDSVSSH